MITHILFVMLHSATHYLYLTWTQWDRNIKLFLKMDITNSAKQLTLLLPILVF